MKVGDKVSHIRKNRTGVITKIEDDVDIWVKWDDNGEETLHGRRELKKI